MPKRDRQLTFRFVERRRSRERQFRRAIVGLTALTIVAMFTILPSGRDLAERTIVWTRQAFRDLIGVVPTRDEIEAQTTQKRARDNAGTRGIFRDIYGRTPPAMRRLLEYAGITPDEAVIRTGNFDKVFVLAGTVYQDDPARSYRLKPNQKSIWLRNVALPHDLTGFFLVPDRPELREIVQGTGAGIVPGSEQTTNSWGCRGPEPDLTAPVRGIVLGDSNMQGLFVADDETPSAVIARELEKSLGQKVSILNTGHLGYSPEQYARTLEEYGDRFKPTFVVLTLCVNDFGDVTMALKGQADWEETRYWLDRAQQWCRTRNVLCVMSPVPFDHQVTAIRQSGAYPDKAADLAGISSLHYVFPIDDLVDEFLRLRLEPRKPGAPVTSNPLYNLHIEDRHFSPLGCEVWGKAVARRLSSLLKWREREKKSRAPG
jgi:lysophospholipase L1-like esterase